MEPFLQHILTLGLLQSRQSRARFYSAYPRKSSLLAPDAVADEVHIEEEDMIDWHSSGRELDLCRLLEDG